MPRPKLIKRKPKKSVTLNDNIIKGLTRLGKGNLSLGIELMFNEMAKTKPAKLKEKEEEAEA